MFKSMSPQALPGVTHRREGSVDIVAWSNRDIPKDPFYAGLFVLGFAAFSVLAVYLTVRLIEDLLRLGPVAGLTGTEIGISMFFLVAMWIVTLFFGFHIARLAWTESIHVGDDGIGLEYSGPLSPRAKYIRERDLWRLSFERYGEDRTQETRYTVNLFHEDKRESLAYWMRKTEQQQLFLLLAALIKQRGWAVDLKGEDRVS